MIRQPIVSVLGHIDHGKTTLLDRIRGTTITAKEAGGITQHIGATEVPIDVVKKICGPLLLNLDVKVTIPGLLFIDTPGHAAFTNLRKRGGSISDIGVLIVDVNEGFKLQTYEALKILQSYKTPFLVVANKIDLIPGWKSNPNLPFLKSLRDQREDVQQVLDTKIYEIVETLYQKGMSSERFDRVKDFTKQVAVVPISAKTGEGLPEFLMVLTGLTQKYLEEQLKTDVSGPGKGTILEVKKTEGLGTTIDVIIYDGSIKRGDTIIVGTRAEPIVTNIKALLKPKPLKEIRIGSQFDNVEEVYAAAGIKIAAPNLDEALAGSPVYVAQNPSEIEKLKSEIKEEIGEVQIQTGLKGVIVKADTLGSLEALVKMLEGENILVRKAGFGDVTRKDLVEASAVKKEDPLLAAIFAFNVKVPPDVEKEASDLDINIFYGDIVYALIDNYKEWVKSETEQTKEQLIKKVILPAQIRILPGYVFRQSKPAIVGVEVEIGTLVSKCDLMNESGNVVGSVKQVQEEGNPVSEAKAGKKVAVSIQGAVVGRNVKEGDLLYVDVPKKDLTLLKTKLSDILSIEELQLIEKIEKLKK